MSASRHERIRRLFDRARRLVGEELEEFIERQCHLDYELREELAELISLDGKAGLLDQPLDEVNGIALDVLDDSFVRRMEEMEARARTHHRYDWHGEMARGGMGSIHRAWDRDLRRELAMKVLIRPDGVPDATLASILKRFYNEALITGQLEHPGVVPVHEFGMRVSGWPFFSMRMVKGRTLAEIFELAREERESWSLTRVLEVMVKVCDTMAYAHSRGVIHRDLKPANVMVGSFGEVYVMDWGLARTEDRPDVLDLRIDATGADQAEDAPRDLVKPLRTMEGTVVGTPSYMSPEQARGDVEAMGPRSDVYALGAMLYELLAGRPPYVEPGAALSPYVILHAVRGGPPVSVHEIRREAPAELVAICERAMSREIARRYADATELAQDLHAYLEGRVVRAYRTGAWQELRKWVQRNRALAVSFLAGLLSLAAGLVVSLLFFDEARANENQALENLRDVLDLSTIQKVEELESQARTGLWPILYERIPAMEDWLARARSLKPVLAKLEGKLVALEAEAVSRDEEGPEHAAWSFRADGQQSATDKLWRQRLLSKLVLRLHALLGEENPGPHGLGIWGESLDEIERRASLASAWHRTSLEDPTARGAWEQAIAYAARPEPYGMELHGIEGLLPLGENPRTGLLEFWHVPSGERPLPNPEWSGGKDEPGSRWIIGERTGLVFVLIPGGTFSMGAQRDSDAEANFDPQAKPDESPVREVSLPPFLISKYELTQGQWLRFTGSNPSTHGPDNFKRCKVTLANPLENVSWNECQWVLDRLAMDFPTEEQWEYACRAGTQTPWWSGKDPEELATVANIADESCKASAGDPNWEYVSWSDGYGVHAPVGSLRANAFGLHDILGNVFELCRNAMTSDGESKVPGANWMPPGDTSFRAYRGGSWWSRLGDVRASARSSRQAANSYIGLGVRPVLPFE